MGAPMVTVRNVGHLPRALGRGLPRVAPGGTLRVVPEIAGRPPAGDDPGVGLLAQHEVWGPVDEAPAAAGEE